MIIIDSNTFTETVYDCDRKEELAKCDLNKNTCKKGVLVMCEKQKRNSLKRINN